MPFMRMPHDTMRLGLPGAKADISHLGKHPVELIQEQVREAHQAAVCSSLCCAREKESSLFFVDDVPPLSNPNRGARVSWRGAALLAFTTPRAVAKSTPTYVFVRRIPHGAAMSA
jgi:hypothetical protein